MDELKFPRSFRKDDIRTRRSYLLHFPFAKRSLDFFRTQQTDLELAEVMIENAVGYFEIPLAVIPDFSVNGKTYNVPLATEEPSVVAAVGYANRVLKGSLTAAASDPVMRAQVFLEGPHRDWNSKVTREIGSIEATARTHLASMEKRGGGLRGVSFAALENLDVVVCRFDVDVRDAMGANVLNTLAEALTGLLESIVGGKKILAILSNDASLRPAWAEFRVSTADLARAGFDGPEMARRIVLASQIAQSDSQRAVTHNKGIMNGITALALSTGNDTRALEAGVHSAASSSGRYRGLSTYRIDGDHLVGRLEIPLALATVGGGISVHPQAQMNLELLGNPSAVELCALAAAVGLAQNFAALFALTAEGIQKGHMGLHEKRVAYLEAKKNPPPPKELHP